MCNPKVPQSVPQSRVTGSPVLSVLETAVSAAAVHGSGTENQQPRSRTTVSNTQKSEICKIENGFYIVKMKSRTALPLLKKLLGEFPAVALLGSRQVGKTTLAKAIGSHYFDLEQETDRQRLDLMWDEVMRDANPAVFDEAQSWPALFPRLRGAIDAERKKNGRFLLLGSVSPALMTHVSESLAGRLAPLELTPFQLPELVPETSVDAHWLYGGYPDGGILTPSLYPRWQLAYLEMLAGRDLPAWGLPAPPPLTTRLLRMLAVAHGQEWNASGIGQSLGINYHTVNGYVDYLENAFLVRRLRPFHANLSKRLCKRPKVYLRDSGILHALLGVVGLDALFVQPWAGASWEGYVIEQILGTMQNADILVTPYFFRTSDQHEVDLLLQTGEGLWAIEIKLTSQPTQDDFRRLEKCAGMVGAKRCFLVSRISESIADSKTERVSCNLPWFLNWLRETWRPSSSAAAV